MSDKPILFNAEMVRAILDGRKTQTRRPVKPQPIPCSDPGGCWYPEVMGRRGKHYASEFGFRKGVVIDFSPFGQPGDRLWVRETWQTVGGVYVPGIRFVVDGAEVFPPEFDNLKRFPRDWQDFDKKRPSIHMPKWAARLWLVVTRVWVERLYDISDDDFLAEGFRGDLYGPEIGAPPGTEDKSTRHMYFMDFWDTLYGKTDYAWERNPWVWGCEFEAEKGAGG